MRLGQEMKERREKMKLTQLAMAKKMGWSSAQMVSNIERGVNHYSFERLEKACKLLKLNYRTSVLKMVSEKTGLKL